ncbi:MAG: hypothetical protein WAT39_25405 [Planctomycetota bacterium]
MFSTHDQTLSNPPRDQFNETWADVKSPGGFPTTNVGLPPLGFPIGFPPTVDNRFTYAAGTIEVVDTGPAALFSGQTVVAPGVVFTQGPGQPNKQVAILQVNTVLLNPIFAQAYYYGTDLNGDIVIDRSTNARAVSVWRTAAPGTDRIAICGETFDDAIPGAQYGPAAGGWANGNVNASTGFIAVFDGNGALQWAYHFFDANNPGTDSCAITDVSIRVDAAGNEIVTYCGVSSHGAAAGGELLPLRQFAAAAPCIGGIGTGLPAGQWDGIVGRVVFPVGAAVAARDCHSIVGGLGQDGLFGLVELDADRFAVVGSSAFPGPGPGGSPMIGACGQAGPYALGGAMVFNAPVLGVGVMVLETATSLGNVGAGFETAARDVTFGRSALGANGGTGNTLYVVGSTNAPLVFALAALPPLPAQAALNGPTDGFVAALLLADQPPAPPQFVLWTGAFEGGPGNDGLTGVSCWSEFSEHVSTVGFTDANGGDITLANYWLNNTVGVANPPQPPSTHQINTGDFNLLRIRQTAIGGTNADVPAAMGANTAFTQGLAWVSVLGQESGGGVGVAEDGRINVVGRTLTGGGYPVFGVGARLQDLLFDAVRTELDLTALVVNPLPTSANVGRSDGTGFPPPGFPPAAPLTGGTTPFCALSPFGIQIGLPAPALPRMLIDFEGALTPGTTDAAILVSRPSSGAVNIAAGVLQFGFPPAFPNALPTGCEIWLGGGVSAVFPALAANQAFRLALAPIPGGTGVISAQVVCLHFAPVVGAFPGCASVWTASPVLSFGL